MSLVIVYNCGLHDGWPPVVVSVDRERIKSSDTGNRTPGYRVRGDNVSHYTISDMSIGASHVKMSEGANGTEATRVPTFQK